MASINDVINQNLARVMANNGAPLRALAEREDREEALRLAVTNRDRQFGQQIALQDRNNAADTARAVDLLGRQQGFLREQGSLDRQSRMDIAKAQARELVSRLDSAAKAKLRVEYPLREGETDETWIKRVAETQGKNVTALYERQNKLDAEIQSDIAKETERRLKVAENQAKRMIGDAVATPEWVSSNSVWHKAPADKKNYEGFLKLLESSKQQADKDTAAQLRSFVANQAQSLAAASDDRGRPLIPESPAHIENLKQKQLIQRSVLGQIDRAIASPDFYGDAYVRTDAGITPSKSAPGVDEARRALEDLNRGVPVERIVTPAAPSAMRSANDMRNLTPAQAQSEMRRLQNGGGPITRFNEGGVPAEFGNAIIDQVNPTLGAIGDLPGQFWGNVKSAVGGITSRIDPYLTGGDSSPLPIPARRGFDNPIYGSPSPQEQAAIAQLFGPDAPDLMADAAKLATANGISQEIQTATYKAALGGNPDAQQKVTSMLDFIRSQRNAPAFVPVFENMQEYPGLQAPLR